MGGPADLKRLIGQDARACADSVVAKLVGGTPEQVPNHYYQASPAEMLPIGVPQILIIGRKTALSRSSLPRPTQELQSRAATRCSTRWSSKRHTTNTIPDRFHLARRQIRCALAARYQVKMAGSVSALFEGPRVCPR